MKFFGAFLSLQALVLSSLNSNPFASQALLSQTDIVYA